MERARDRQPESLDERRVNGSHPARLESIDVLDVTSLTSVKDASNFARREKEAPTEYIYVFSYWHKGTAEERFEGAFVLGQWMKDNETVKQ